MLPFEEENTAGIARMFSGEFEFGADTLLAAVDFLDNYLPTVDMRDGRIRGVISGIMAREMRRYRSILAILELGYVENASVLTRTLYEAVLSARFVLCTPDNPTTDLEQELAATDPSFRAVLYATFPVVQLRKQVEQIQRHHGEIVDADQELRSSQLIEEATSVVGEEWVNRLRKNTTCAGLPVVALARYCGMIDTHLKIYSLLCGASHAGDALQFVSPVEAGEAVIKVAPEVSNIRLSFVLATTVFCHLIHDIDEHFGVGFRGKLDVLAARLAAFEKMV